VPEHLNQYFQLFDIDGPFLIGVYCVEKFAAPLFLCYREIPNAQILLILSCLLLLQQKLFLGFQTLDGACIASCLRGQ
jgi:hypothetical protein